MDVYICNGCKAQVKETKPDSCPICGRTDFSKEDIPDDVPVESESSKKYKEVVKTLEKYNEGCEPESHKYRGGCE